ncbi:MAG: EF-hand domain-containing protein [Vulcanimicrobiota bacterium]
MSPLRRRKLLKLFAVTDVDGNGVIELEDYRRVLEFLSQRRGWGQDHPDYQRLQTMLAKNWESLQSTADINGDGMVTQTEWLTTWENFYQQLPTSDSVPAWFEQFARALFEALDIDSDGRICKADYQTFLEAHGLSEDVDTIFSRLDLNGDGHISWDEALQLAAEFHLGDDADAPGCWLYGELTA